MRRWQDLVPGVVTGVVVVAVTAWVWSPAESPAKSTVIAPDPRIVDPSVPEYKLLESVLYVDDWREFGNPVGFTYVPKSRPPGLISIGPGNPPNLSGGSHRGTGNGALIDGYNFKAGKSRLSGVVEFSARPTSTCQDAKEMTAAVCVRNTELSRPSPTDPEIRRMTVYFTGPSDAALTSPAARQITLFWAGVEMVPVGEATWFADLVTRARAAVLTRYP